jgi:hypothetical protein
MERLRLAHETWELARDRLIAFLAAADVPGACGQLPARRFLSERGGGPEAVETRGRFNIIPPSSGLEIDVFVNKAIARGLMARPQCLLLDEPSLGLAPIVVTEIARTIRALAARGLTIGSSSRTRRGRWSWPTAPTSSSPAASPSRAPPPTSPAPTSSGRSTWAVGVEGDGPRPGRCCRPDRSEDEAPRSPLES